MNARAYWHVIGCAESCEFELPDGGCEAQDDACSCITWDLCVAAATKDREIERLRAELSEYCCPRCFSTAWDPKNRFCYKCNDSLKPIDMVLGR